MAVKKELTTDDRVKREITRLKKIYAGIAEKDMQLLEGLLVQAARLRVMLDDMWADICCNGDVEQFSQSANQEPYERLRPVATLFNQRDKAYQTIIKLLNDKKPEEPEKQNELIEFLERDRE